MTKEPKDNLRGLAALFQNVGSAGLDPQRTAFRDLITGILTERSIVPPLLPPPPVILDRWFKDQTFKVDGYTFERCRFDRCKLVSEMATFTFKNCFISGDCELYFTGPALSVARLLMHMLRMKGRITVVEGEEALYATINLDGTFSLE